MAQALFGAGCFWGVQEKFHNLNGVNDTQVGYAGGHTKNPTYKEVCSGTTNHVEVCLVDFDEGQVSYQQLLDFFFKIHDSTTLNRQGYDTGTQYRSVIYYSDEQQRISAETKKQQLVDDGVKAVTEISCLVEFWQAEEYHQHYVAKSKKGFM